MGCYCGLANAYEECCGAIIAGERIASSAQELMRSRYCAFINGDGKYLVKSTIDKNRFEEDIDLINKYSPKWLKLDILNASKYSVEFKAYYKENNQIKVHHEISSFIFEDDRWFYDEGKLLNAEVGRNELCPCGSGKKYKKCCVTQA